MEQRLVFAGDAVFAAGELAFPDSNRNALRFVLPYDRQYETCHRNGWRAAQGNGEHAVALAISEVRGIAERACARQDVLDACARRDLGAVITLLKGHGITQGMIAELTGIPQGRLSEWRTAKRKPSATSTFESFADGLGMPPAARRALGLDSGAPASPRPAAARVLEAPKPDIGLEYPGTPRPWPGLGRLASRCSPGHNPFSGSRLQPRATSGGRRQRN